MIAEPDSAPPRSDLTFLQRRSRPRAVPPPAATGGTSRTSPTRATSAQPIDYTHHSTAKAASAPSASRPVIDFSRPGHAPRPGASQPAPAPAGGVNYRHDDPPPSGSLDLSDPAPVAAPATSGPPASPSAQRRPAADPLPRYRGPRVSAGQQLLLGPDTPTATLTRVQSGVGRLTVQAICSPEIGDLRLGALYQLRSGGTSTVQLAGGNRFAPSSRRPVILASREQYEQLAIDLRQIRDIERLSVYAFSESRAPLTWGGTLVITTFGGARIELPLETLAPASVAVLMSFYNLSGELVVRTEFETIDGDIREAARAYGYDRITWRDDRSPID